MAKLAYLVRMAQTAKTVSMAKLAHRGKMVSMAKLAHKAPLAKPAPPGRCPMAQSQRAVCSLATDLAALQRNIT
jgi:hypothetical protein